MPNLWARKYSVLVLLASLFVCNMTVNSNNLSSNSHDNQEQKATWVRYTTAGEEFSVLMPELPRVDRDMMCLDVTCKFARVDDTWAAYSNGVVYVITSSIYPDGRLTLEEIIAERIDEDELSSSDTVKVDVTLNRFKGKKFTIASKKYGFDVLLAFYLTDKHLYEVKAVGGSRNDPSIQKFFKSFTLGSNKGIEIADGARLGKDSTAPPPAPKTINQDSKSQQRVTKGIPSQTIFKPIEVTRKGVIVLKPSPEYTEEARQNQVTGTVTLQMVFDSSGKVVNIRTISGLPFGLTERAIGAAKRIFFVPAVKDGKRVSQYIRVEYNFNIY